MHTIRFYHLTELGENKNSKDIALWSLVENGALAIILETKLFGNLKGDQ